MSPLGTDHRVDAAFNLSASPARPRATSTTPQQFIYAFAAYDDGTDTRNPAHAHSQNRRTHWAGASPDTPTYDEAWAYSTDVHLIIDLQGNPTANAAQYEVTSTRVSRLATTDVVDLFGHSLRHVRRAASKHLLRRTGRLAGPTAFAAVATWTLSNAAEAAERGDYGSAAYDVVGLAPVVGEVQTGAEALNMAYEGVMWWISEFSREVGSRVHAIKRAGIPGR